MLLTLIAKIRTHWRRLVLAIVGQGSYQLLNAFVDFILCPALILWSGVLWGGLMYVAIGVTIDLASMIIYDKAKADIFGFELVKELRGWFGSRVLRSRKKISSLSFVSKLIVVLGLSWRLNPFQVVVFMRQANEYRQKMSTEERVIFFISFISGNLYWVILMGGIVKIGEIVV